eukprot:gene24428-30772_t
MTVNQSVFVELDFFLLIALSLLLPAAIYGYMMWKRALSRLAIFGFGLSLVVLAGVNVGVLRAIGTVNDAAGKRMEAGPNGELVPAPAPGILFDRMFSRNFAAVYVDEAGERHPVGRWTVYSSQQVVVRQVAYGFFLILVNSVIKTLALWFIFLYVIKRTLGQPLRQMSDFVGQLNIDNIGDRHFVLKDKGKHELHQLTDKLNQMAGTLRKSVAENAELYAELKEMNRTLESQVAERTRELQRVASTDMLTGLHNRRKLDEVLGYEVERVHRYGGGLALEGACALAEMLRLRIAAAEFPEVGRKTCSFGVAALGPDETLPGLVARADAALYRAKQGGRNAVEHDTITQLL